jgi:hypothetical protein
MQAENMASPAEQDRRIDTAIMGLLLDSPALWSDAEIYREIGDEIATVDALARLAREGLVHRLDGFVFISRSAASALALAA